jgi:hypothetical protein
VSVLLSGLDEILGRQADVLSDLADEGRADVASTMHWYGGGAPIGMTELFMRASLADFDEAEVRQDRHDFASFEWRNAPHVLGDLERMRPHELRLKLWFAVFEKHGDDFPQVGLELFH